MDQITEFLAATPDAIARAGRMLAQGRLVAFPTETVYGLGGNAADDRAVAAIFAAKNRPQFNPLIVHLPDAAAAAAHVVMPPAAERLAAAFWPGPLTLVLPRRPDTRLSLLVSAGLDSVAVRVPAHPVARALLHAAGCPVAAPSANPSGQVSPTRAEHVRAGLAGRLALILDGGPCAVGVESTVVDLSGAGPVLLRPGGVTREQIEAILGPVAVSEGSAERPNAPGQLTSHYAPGLPVRLDAVTVAADEALLAFGRDVPTGAAVTLNLSASGDLAEAAAALFAGLRALDRPGLRGIAVMPVPEHGLGLAINDRLRRAAAPRG